jgi:hypothetical protein
VWCGGVYFQTWNKIVLFIKQILEHIGKRKQIVQTISRKLKLRGFFIQKIQRITLVHQIDIRHSDVAKKYRDSTRSGTRGIRFPLILCLFDEMDGENFFLKFQSLLNFPREKEPIKFV